MIPPLLLYFLLFLGAYDVTRMTCKGQAVTDEMTWKRVMSQVTRQLMLQQLYVEEMTRSTWDSGVKQIRRRRDGPRSYYTETHNGKSVVTIHDHSSNVRVVGLGAFTANLNGVEFRTRHNDYQLKMPSTTSQDYHATEDVPFPEVPPEVTEKESLDEQISEMREWFKAWQQGNHSVRDYRKYFRPNLCYLEGAWTTDTKTISEPFASDRHQLDASSWYDLQEKFRFTSYTGNKDYKENWAFLPTTILNTTEDGLPQFGQWNYRILCHPIKGQFDLSHLKPVENLANRLSTKKTLQEHVLTRRARFRVESPDDDHRWSLLDDMMHEIPGKDNYKAEQQDSLFGRQKVHVITEKALNTGFYHRGYKVLEKDAMGETTMFRGYADRNLFVAVNTRDPVAAMSFRDCRTPWQRRHGNCSMTSQKVSYAIPLEIVYLTPLHSWNPHNVHYKGMAVSPEGKTVIADKRNGFSKEKAYNGTHSKLFYQTPAKFFHGGEVGASSADTTRRSVWVLNKTGTPHEMSATGVRVFLPNIPGVGVLRTRWPILPVSTEGHPVWKELEALRDVVMDMKSHLKYFPITPPLPDEVLRSTPTERAYRTLVTSPSTDVFGTHTHVINLTRDQYMNLLKHNGTEVLYTSTEMDHSHQLVLNFNETSRRMEIVRCDRMPTCFDGHGPRAFWKKV